MGLGIDNDTLGAYEDCVEAHIVKVPPDNQVKRARLKDLAREIVMRRVAVKNFDDSPDGSIYNKLQQQQRDAGKSMTDDEVALLTSLDAQRTVLTFARDVAKQAKNDDAIAETERRLDIFDRSKAGGKKRTYLMAKKRKCGRQLTAEQKTTLDRVLPIRQALAKARDGAVKEKKDLSDKLNDNIQARRKERKCWFIPMDRLYRKHGVKREDYHKRKFSGKPLQQIKQEAKAIFCDTKQLLREHK